MSLAVLAVLALAGPARAEIALLGNGQTLKLEAHRAEGETVTLALKGGGEVSLAAGDVVGFVPDEVLDEVVPAAAADASDLRGLATAAALRHGLAPELVLAVIAVESGFQPAAVSPKGAQGLMQLMPGTARALGVSDALDPAQNVDGGTRYLKQLVAEQQGDLTKALAAYNAGPGAVKRHGGVPPYKETRAYVRRVLRRYSAPAPDTAPAAGEGAKGR
jgi:soluble lytic murein transglycosylase-like protein